MTDTVILLSTLSPPSLVLYFTVVTSVAFLAWSPLLSSTSRMPSLRTKHCLTSPSWVAISFCWNGLSLDIGVSTPFTLTLLGKGREATPLLSSVSIATSECRGGWGVSETESMRNHKKIRRRGSPPTSEPNWGTGHTPPRGGSSARATPALYGAMAPSLGRERPGTTPAPVQRHHPLTPSAGVRGRRVLRETRRARRPRTDNKPLGLLSATQTPRLPGPSGQSGVLAVRRD